MDFLGYSEKMPKRIVTLSDELDKELRRYLAQEYHGKRGALSIVVEESLRRFIQEETKRRLT